MAAKGKTKLNGLLPPDVEKGLNQRNLYALAKQRSSPVANTEQIEKEITAFFAGEIRSKHLMKVLPDDYVECLFTGIKYTSRICDPIIKDLLEEIKMLRQKIANRDGEKTTTRPKRGKQQNLKEEPVRREIVRTQFDNRKANLSKASKLFGLTPNPFKKFCVLEHIIDEGRNILQKKSR